jgi:hypothetical protein
MTPTELATELAAKGYHVTPDHRVSELVAAVVLGVSPRTLERWRAEGTAPASVVIGRRWYWLADLLIYERPARAAG